MYKRILVAVDVDDPASWERAIPVASAVARCFSAGITLCSVVRGSTAALEAQWSTIAYRELLDTTRAKLDLIGRQSCEQIFDVAVGSGTISSGILEVAETALADLIVISSHRPGLEDHIFSAHGARVARRAHCSVLIVRADSDFQPSEAEQSN